MSGDEPGSEVGSWVGEPDGREISPTSADPEVGQAAEVLSSMQEAPLKSDVSSHLVTMLSREDMDHRVMRKGVRYLSSYHKPYSIRPF
jgi:hypothetical protein